MTRPTLNGRQARTMRDAGRDPYDWMTGPHQHAKDRAAGAVLAVAIGVCFALGVWLHLGA